MELHKSICIETGDALAQTNPERTPLIALKKPSFDKRKLSTEELARSLMQKLRIPMLDGVVPPRYQPPARLDFEKQLDIVLKGGSRDATYSHPDLPGMEFSSEEYRLAFSLMLYGDFFTRVSGAGLNAPLELAPLLNVLCQIEDFADATTKKDRRAQARFALEITSKASYVTRLMDDNAGLDAPEAWVVAEEDFALAAKMASEYSKVKFSSPDSLTRTAVKRMLQIGKENPDMAEFDIAISVITEKRANRESLTTLTPPPPELVQQVAQVALEPDTGRLVFPFSNDVLDIDLENHLPKGDDPQAKLVRRVGRTLRYYVSLGQTDNVPDVYLPAVTRLLHIYSHGELVEFAQMLVETETKKPRPSKTLMMGSAAPAARTEELPVHEPALAPATALADTPEETTRPDVRPITMMIEKLQKESPNSLELAMEILGRTGGCTEADLEDFMKMHAGVRDLRLRNILSRVWTNGDWRGQPEVNEPSEFEHKRSCMDMLYRVCGLETADLNQMWEAATDKANLSANQLAVVGKLFGVSHQSATPQMIEGFAVWMSGDPRKLKAYWEANYPDVFALINLTQKMVMKSRSYSDEDLALLGKVFGKPADKIKSDDIKNVVAIQAYLEQLRKFEHFWSSPTLEQRRNIWKYGNLDTLLVTDLVHRVAFLKGWQYAAEDYRLIARIYEKNPESPDEMNNLTTAFVNAILQKSTNSGHNREVAELHNKLVANPLKDILESARAHDEFATLCDFLNVPSGKAKGKLVSENSTCRPKIAKEKYLLESTFKDQGGVFMILHRTKNGTMSETKTVRFISQSTVGAEQSVEIEAQGECKTFQVITAQDGKQTLFREYYNETNDDSLSQALVTLENGEKIELDAVFDGMGGHDGGYIASGFMKSAFEISALSGWITTPEDARKIIVMADVIITLEQFKKKQFGPRKMGTTATIGFQKGEDFYAIHCGDSDVKVFRGGQMIFSTLGHSLVNQILELSGVSLDNKAKAAADMITRYATSVHVTPQDTNFRILGTDTLKASTDGRNVQFTILRDGNPVCQGQGSPILHEKLIEILESEIGNVVTGAVGNTINTTTINNKKHDYSPLKTEKGDIKLICSDGITVPLCAHEVLIAIEQCNGDLAQASELLVEWAEARRPNGQNMFKPNCSCDERGTKNDDKSTILKCVD